MWGERNCLSFETAAFGIEPPSPRLKGRRSTARPPLPTDDSLRCKRLWRRDNDEGNNGDDGDAVNNEDDSYYNNYDCHVDYDGSNDVDDDRAMAIMTTTTTTRTTKMVITKISAMVTTSYDADNEVHIS